MESQQEKPVTFEDLVALDKQMKNVKLESFQTESVATDVASKLKQVCSIYKTIRPVLQVIVGLPFIPGKDVIKKFMSILDTVCV